VIVVALFIEQIDPGYGLHSGGNLPDKAGIASLGKVRNTLNQPFCRHV
jgi:hypothetical protein